MKISRNRITNQLASTPIRNPNRFISFIEERGILLQWSHRFSGDPNRRRAPHRIQENE